MIPVAWGAVVSRKNHGGGGSACTGGPSLGSAVAAAVSFADYYQRLHPENVIVVQIGCECAMCGGMGRVPNARSRVAYATKVCPACKGKVPEAKSLEFEFEYLKERL